jgi:ABC-type molybdate transport system permease subunit
MAYASVVIQSRLKEMDRSIEEAALDLGCRPFQVFFLVTLPNSGNEWQVIRIDDATALQSVARTLKAKPGIPVNALATLMR